MAYDYEKERKARLKKERAEMEKTVKEYPLPDGVEIDDLFRPENYQDQVHFDDTINNYDRNQLNSFEIWSVEGRRVNSWCIPVLLISKGKGAQPDRNYAIQTDGAMCRIGKGPHVKACLTVYVTVHNKKRLIEAGYLSLIRKGQMDAGQTRDIISTNRAQGALRRAVRGW